MDPRMALIIALVFIVIIFNLIFMFRRAGRGAKGKGRNYVPPSEVKRTQWRDKEIARRIQREQDDAYERVKLRNETLDYYEIVRQRHAKIEILGNLGVDVTGIDLDDIDNLDIQELVSRKRRELDK